jgi:hypothetical protein
MASALAAHEDLHAAALGYAAANDASRRT